MTQCSIFCCTIFSWFRHTEKCINVRYNAFLYKAKHIHHQLRSRNLFWALSPGPAPHYHAYYNVLFWCRNRQLHKQPTTHSSELIHTDDSMVARALSVSGQSDVLLRRGSSNSLSAKSCRSHRTGFLRSKWVHMFSPTFTEFAFLVLFLHVYVSLRRNREIAVHVKI